MNHTRASLNYNTVHKALLTSAKQRTLKCIPPALDTAKSNPFGGYTLISAFTQPSESHILDLETAYYFDHHERLRSIVTTCTNFDLPTIKTEFPLSFTQRVADFLH